MTDANTLFGLPLVIVPDMLDDRFALVDQVRDRFFGAIEARCELGAATSAETWLAVSPPEFREASQSWVHSFVMQEGPVPPELYGWTIYGPWPLAKVARATISPSHGATREQG